MRKILFILFSLVLLASQAQQSVTSGEYFWDTDPGVGNGTAFTFTTSGASVSESLEFNTTGLSTGIHLLMVRTLTDSGYYSLYTTYPVKITTVYESPVTQLEFSWDSVSTMGSGELKNLSSTGDSDTSEFEIDVPSGMSLADHKLNVRAKSTNDIWGLYEPVPIKVCTQYGPKASFDMNRQGILAEFKNASTNATSYLWDFGDGSTDTAQNPLHLFEDVGQYSISMVATNSCGSDTAFLTFTTGGIASVSPDIFGEGGLVSGIIAGQAFITDSSRFRLVHSSNSDTIIPESHHFLDNFTLAFSLNLDSVATGTYNLEYIVGDTVHYFLSDAFTIEPYKEPELDIWVEGPRIMRQGRFYSHDIIIENKGNVDAIMVPIHYQSMNLDNIGQFGIFFEYENLLDDIDTFRTLRNEAADLGADTTASKQFVINYPDYGEEAMKSLSFIVPRLKPGLTKYTMTLVVYQNDLRVQTNARVGAPLLSSRASDLRLKSDTVNGRDCLAKGLVCSINFLQNLLEFGEGAHPGVDCLKGLFSLADAASQDFYGASLSERAASLVTGGDSRNLDNNNAELKVISIAAKPISYAEALRASAINCTLFAADLVAPGAGTVAKTIVNVGAKAKQFKDAVEGEMKIVNRTIAVKKMIFEDLPCFVDLIRACTGKDFSWALSSITSLDPNAKYGPGLENDNFINPDDPLHYSITFENVATAGAAAQEVFVYDSLDVNVFDFGTFKFAGYGWDTLSFSSFTETRDEGIHKFTDVIDITPGHPNYVLVEGEFDENTGFAKWKFVTLDTSTLQLTSDVFEGFLPPNNDAPEGEGYVSFRVELKEGLSEGTPIRNKASIVFDVNAPIVTNTWENLFDVTPPVSSVNSLDAISSDTVLRLNWSGTDNISGIKSYDLYVNSDGGEFFLVVPGLDTTSMLLTVLPDVLYGFYTVATDSAGNVEDHPSTPDATTTVSLGVEDISKNYHGHWLGENVPNPAASITEIPYFINGGQQFSFEVLDINGKQLQRIEGQNLVLGVQSSLQLDVSGFAKGVYLYTLVVDGVKLTKKMVVQ